jgi:formate-dependent nitrite reductase cytochrome c552 subunit
MPTECRNCESTDLKWCIGTAGPTDVPDGRIRMSEVYAIAYLSCEECGETLSIIQEDEINRMLNKPCSSHLVRSSEKVNYS